MIRGGVLLGAGALLLVSSLAGAQQGDLSAPAARLKQYITYAAEEQTVAAGKKTVLELRFHVNEGFHVNSHTPKSELLIPTKLTLQPEGGVKAEAAQYPAGTSYSFSFQPGEKLDVYTGAFTVKIPVVADAGSHTMTGVLRYQACDNAACYPPKSLPVEVAVTAK
ncbi:MAG TPA: protein-disulfide reductase DsbD N-terminal domain-containing protein [Edaphobacter sp.]|nr:protein-disulfide reductase DsbD N-terminal domain-containing protein [Edaphobacter sp.]